MSTLQSQARDPLCLSFPHQIIRGSREKTGPRSPLLLAQVQTSCPIRARAGGPWRPGNETTGHGSYVRLRG